MATVQDLINVVGTAKPLNVDGADAGQCTAIPHKWEQMLGLGIVYGNAKDTYTNAPAALYDKELNSPTNFPRPGAIIVWNANWGGGYGHTAVIVSANSNSFECFEQNDGPNKLPRIGIHDYSNVIGWFYPKVLSAAPAPTPGRGSGGANPEDAPMTDPQEQQAYQIVLGRPRTEAYSGRTAMQFILDAQNELNEGRAAVAGALATAQTKIDQIQTQATNSAEREVDLEQELSDMTGKFTAADAARATLQTQLDDLAAAAARYTGQPAATPTPTPAPPQTSPEPVLDGVQPPAPQSTTSADPALTAAQNVHLGLSQVFGALKRFVLIIFGNNKKGS